MLTLHVDNKDYVVEFTFEAAESDIVNTAFDFFSGAYMLKTLPADEKTLKTKEGQKQVQLQQLDVLFEQASKTPRLTIDFLYMGLLEHHGECGDKSTDIKTRNDAKMLYKKFCKENPDSELAMHTGLFEALKGQMEEDGFFKRIGLDLLMESVTGAVQAEEPQKEKSTKA